MKKENNFFLLVLIASSVIILAAFFFSKPARTPEVPKGDTNNSTQRQVTVAQPTGQNSFNPDYGELTAEQIKIADIAVGKLLNGTEGVTPPMIKVKSFEAKQFGNTSLGCPEEGKMYAEVITPGYQVVLEAQGKEYDYRLTGEKDIILCEQK